VTLAFWLVKILATTVGETGGDALSMSLKLGYAVSTLIFLCFFCITTTAQVASRRYRPVFYWAVVVATTTVGTTTSDYFDRTLGLGYVRSSAILLLGVIAVLVIWKNWTGAVAVDQVTSRTDETFYWLTILVSNMSVCRRKGPRFCRSIPPRLRIGVARIYLPRFSPFCPVRPGLSLARYDSPSRTRS